MSTDLKELYREVILDHNRNPRNFGEIEDADRRIDGVNPLCGDRMSLFLKLGENGTIDDIKFQGSGCAISVASSSLMTERVKGLSQEDALELFELVHDVLTGTQSDEDDKLEKLAALSGVREYPSRVKCASLSWHALKTALTSEEERISTE